MEVPPSQPNQEKDIVKMEESNLLVNDTEQSFVEPRFSSFLQDFHDFESQRVSLTSEKEFDDVFNLKRMGYFVRPKCSQSERSDSTANLPSSFYTSQRPTRPESYALNSSEDRSLINLRAHNTVSQDQAKHNVPKTAKFSIEDLSFCKKPDSLSVLLNQLYLKIERQKSLKSYCESVNQQIQESLKINIADLQSKRNSLVAKLDLYLEESINIAKQIEAKKQAELFKNQSELDLYIQEIDTVIEKLKNREDKDEKTINHIVKEAKTYLKEKFDEKFINKNWIWDKPVDFNYDITKKETNYFVLSTTDNKKSRNKSTVSHYHTFETPKSPIKPHHTELKCKHCTKRHTRKQEIFPQKTLATRFLDNDLENSTESRMSINLLKTSNVFDLNL